MHFLSSSYAGEWLWECGDAAPDRLKSENPDCRVPRHWKVSVQWTTKDGSTIDGPSLVAVDIEAGNASFES